MLTLACIFEILILGIIFNFYFYLFSKFQDKILQNDSINIYIKNCKVNILDHN